MKALDQNTIDYIFDYSSELMTDKEALAYRHYGSLIKLRDKDINDRSDFKVDVYWKNNWLTSNKETLDLLIVGFDNFKMNIATRIFAEHQSEIFFNYCPICKQLARTPKAKQCRQGHTW